MSPESARIFWVEDDDDYRRTRTEFLEREGHIVVEVASSFDEAVEKIPSLQEKGINVAIVDGNLDPGENSGREGETIAKKIKSEHPSITVIGNSFEKPIGGVDINCPKVEGIKELVSKVKSA